MSTNQNKIQSHNTRLEALEEAINALPDADTSEDLTAVLDAQEQLISELEAELEGKASGGGVVETCTVTIDTTGGGIIGGCVVNCYENNELIYKSIPYQSSLSVINLTNVICGSSFLLSLYGNGSYLKNKTPVGVERIIFGYPSNLEYLFGYKITAKQDENIIIEVMTSEK